MLKLTYTESSFDLECLTLSLEEWVAQRVILALRVGQSLCIEPSTASFLLPVDLPGVEVLKAEVKRDDREIIALCASDTQYMEVTLQGSWLSDSSKDAVGVFFTTMSDRAEFFLHKLWQEAQACTSVMSE
ncbi:MAG: alr0857 family protein [Nostoc sp.]|uniref:alr0857 family protein n=1 Tax=Nostoc sp. TaxID=1180 RepID=UPI002FFBC44A